MSDVMERPCLFVGTFSNGFIKKVSDGRRNYTHAWHAKGSHCDGVSFSFSGYSTCEAQAARNMRTMIGAAPPERVTFAEVVEVRRTP
jgi:hypothetical protein